MNINKRIESLQSQQSKYKAQLVALENDSSSSFTSIAKKQLKKYYEDEIERIQKSLDRISNNMSLIQSVTPPKIETVGTYYEKYIAKK